MKSYGAKKTSPLSRREQVTLQRSVSQVDSQTKKATAKAQRQNAGTTKVKGAKTPSY